MAHQLKFTKVTGAGNDFVLIDDRDRSLRVDPAPLARLLCSRNFGVGADGILLVLPSATAHFTMGYYNADGSTGGMCGNGGRCIARYAYDRGIAPADMRFEAFGHLYRARITEYGVRLEMKLPTDFRRGIVLQRLEAAFTADYVNTGSPHAVVEVNDVDELDVAGVGRWICHHPEFAPAGTNANFVQAIGPDAIKLRTYERGVEAETLACGTGSVASALMHRVRSAGSNPVSVSVRSGTTLRVHIEQKSNGEYTAISLEGEAYNVFDGNALIDDAATRLWACEGSREAAR